MASISLRGVQKAYGDGALVIRDVDLEIGENEFTFNIFNRNRQREMLA